MNKLKTLFKNWNLCRHKNKIPINRYTRILNGMEKVWITKYHCPDCGEEFEIIDFRS